MAKIDTRNRQTVSCINKLPIFKKMTLNFKVVVLKKTIHETAAPYIKICHS